MSEEEISSLGLKEFEELEEKRMRENAWMVARELANRLDGAPVLSEYIHGLVAEPIEEQFFDRENIKLYSASSVNMKNTVPGAGYIRKTLEFFDTHFQVGELYMEYIKGGCVKTLGKLCSYCEDTPWVGPHMERIPRPYPDYERLPAYHYKDVFDSPHETEDGNDRPPDDFNPRAALRKAFDKDELQDESLEEFCDKYIVEQKHAESYLEHLRYLKYMKGIRAQDRQKKRDETQEKGYEEYDWSQLSEKGQLGKLKVSELEKYLKHHQLSEKGLKADKVRRIMFHVLKEVGSETVIEVQTEEQPDHKEYQVMRTIADSEVESDDETDEYQSQNSDSEQGNEASYSEGDSVPQLPSQIQTSRSGRVIKKVTSDDFYYC